jgi:hypothetical protein
MLKIHIINKNEAIAERLDGSTFSLYSSENIRDLVSEFLCPQTGYDCLSVCKSSTEDTQILQIDVVSNMQLGA